MSVPTFHIRTAATLTGMSLKAVSAILDALPDDAGIEQLVAAFVSAARAEAPPSDDYSPASDPTMPSGVFSINALHELFLIDRATIEKRFRKEGIKPAYTKPRADGRAAVKGYRLTQQGKSGLTVKAILEADKDPKLTEVTVRDRLASARNKELDYEERSGAIRTQILREYSDEMLRIFKAIDSRIIKRFWRDNLKRLRQCKSDAELQRIGETDQRRILNAIKSEYPQVLEESQ